MSVHNDLKRNASGCKDPTAYEAIRRVDSDRERFEKVLATIFNVCDLADFHIEGRITIRDKRTGEIYK